MDRRTVILTFGAFITGSSNFARSMAAVPKPAAEPISLSTLASTSSSSAMFTANLAFQDPMGGTNATHPDYESVHLMADGRIASIGWIGIHATDYSNAIYAFNPDTNTVDLLAPWEQYISAKDLTPKIPPVRNQGYNKHCATYDNHPSAYFAATNTLVWFGHCVFDVTGKKYIRGNRPPHTSNWETYATGHNGMWSTYNPAYAQCPALNVVAFYGSSYGGYGTPNTAIVVWRKTGPESAPWQATVTNLAAQGMLPIANARNSATCLGTKMYVGGGRVGPGVMVSNSVFTKADHGYRDGFEFALFPDTGQDGVPQGMTAGQIYYVRDVTPNTFRITDSPGGKAIKVAEKSGSLGAAQNYRMWSIDLNDLTVELVSTEWGLGVLHASPQLLADTLRNRLVLVGKNVSEFNPATRVWSAIPVKGWPTGGFKAVGGTHVARYDKVFFRGTPRSGPAEPACWQWNSIAFAGGGAATPPPPPPQPVPQTGALLRTSAGRNSSYVYVDAAIGFKWSKPGGDWLDADGVKHGPKPFGAGKIAVAGPQEVVLDITSMMLRLLKENTGIYLKYVASGGWVHWAQSENPAYPGPKLEVKRTNGSVVNCPLLVDVWIDRSVAGGLHNFPKFEVPTILKFDLSGVTDAASAKLKLFTYQQGQPLNTIGAFYLDPPIPIDNPAASFPETPGEARTADVLFQGRFDTEGQMLANGWWPRANVKVPSANLKTDGTGNIVITLQKGSNYGCNFRKRVGVTADNFANGSKPVPTEIYVSFPLTVGLDAGDIEGVKLPGASAMWAFGPMPYLGKYGCSLRTEHSAGSAQNPDHLGHFTYSYVPGQVGSGSGSAWWTGQDKHFLLRKGQKYHYQQHVKLNSFDKNGPVADAVYELWVDWVKLYEKKNFFLRTDPRVAIDDWLIAQVYHGGVALATHNATYTLGPVTVATEFIGRTLLR